MTFKKQILHKSQAQYIVDGKRSSDIRISIQLFQTLLAAYNTILLYVYCIHIEYSLVDLFEIHR